MADTLTSAEIRERLEALIRQAEEVRKAEAKAAREHKREEARAQRAREREAARAAKASRAAKATRTRRAASSVGRGRPPARSVGEPVRARPMAETLPALLEVRNLMAARNIGVADILASLDRTLAELAAEVAAQASASGSFPEAAPDPGGG